KSGEKADGGFFERPQGRGMIAVNASQDSPSNLQWSAEKRTQLVREHRRPLRDARIGLGICADKRPALRVHVLQDAPAESFRLLYRLSFHISAFDKAQVAGLFVS